MKRATWTDVAITFYLLTIVIAAAVSYLIHQLYHVVRKRLTFVGRYD